MLLEGQETSATHKRFIMTGIPSGNIFNAQGDDAAFQKAVEWLYPNGYNPDHAAKNVVLATTNVSGMIASPLSILIKSTLHCYPKTLLLMSTTPTGILRE